MRTITYVNTSENPATGNRNVNFVASDAVGASNTATRQVAVTAVNDAPVNTVPGTQTTAVNTAKVFTGGSLISIADDATSARCRSSSSAPTARRRFRHCRGCRSRSATAPRTPR